MKSFYTYTRNRLTIVLFFFAVVRLSAQDVVVTNFFGFPVGSVQKTNTGFPNEVQVLATGGLTVQSGSPSCDASAAYSLRTGVNGEYLEAYTPNCELGTVTFSVSGNGSSSSGVYAWSKDGVAWTSVSFSAPDVGSCYSPKLTPPVGTKYFRIGRGGVLGGGSTLRIYNFSVSAKITGPTLTTSLDSLTALDYVAGTGPSGMKQFTISGVNLTANKPIVVTAPADFEVSSDGITWGATAQIPNVAGGSLPATAVFARLKAGLTLSSYTGSITITGGGTVYANPSVGLSGGIISSSPQQNCSSASSTTVYLGKETFGDFPGNTSADRSTTPYIDATAFTYTTSGIGDNGYAVLANTSFGGSYAVSGPDHTIDPPGRFGGVLLVNCGNTAGKVLYSNVFPICSGANVEFSAWYADANAHRNGGYAYVPNITFNIYGATSASGPFTLVKSTTPPALAKVESVTPIWHQLLVPLTSGAYTFMKLVVTNNVSATDGNDLLLDDITFSAQLPITVCTTDATCNAKCDGKITVTRASGSANYNFWLNSVNKQTGTVANYVDLCADDYKIRVQDQSGTCYFDLPASITSPTAIVAKATSVSSCSDGLSIVTISVSGGTPGYLFKEGIGSWSSDYQLAGLSNGVHTIDIKDGFGCMSSATTTVSITTPASLTLTKASGSSSQTVCSNEAITDIKFAVGGGATGATVSGLPSGMSGSFSSGIFIISGKSTIPGTYQYTVTTSGTPVVCQTTQTGSIIVYPEPSVGIKSNNGPICFGKDASFELSGTPNATVKYRFNSDISSSVKLSATGNAILTKTNVVSDQVLYLESIMDNATQCSLLLTESSKLSVNALPTVSIIDNSGAVCLGAEASFSLQGTADAVLSYTLNGQANKIAMNTSGLATIKNSVTTANQKLILVSIDDAVSGCSRSLTESSTVTIHAQPTAQILNTNSPICSGKTAQFAIKGTENSVVTYSLNSNTNNSLSIDATGAASININAANEKQTLVLVTVKDVTTQCVETLSTTASVIVNPIPTITLHDTTICANGSATISAGTHEQYLWSTGATTSGISATKADTYKVTVSDKGCSDSSQMTLSVTPLPMPNLGIDKAVCDSVRLSPSGVFDSYQWSSGESAASLLVTQSGKYAVTVSKSGCSSNDTVDITVYQTPNFSIGSDTAICAGQSMQLNAGSNAGSYKWSTGESTQKITVATASSYSVTITVGNTCSSSASRKLDIKALPTITISGNQAVCPKETITITASGADSYIWDDASTAATRKLTPTTSGTASVTANTSGCVSDTTIAITVKPLPIISTSGNQTICWGKSTAISVSGSATDYNWDNGLGQGTNFTVQPTNNNTYHVTATLDKCSLVDSIIITVNPKVIVKPGKDTAICLGSDVTLEANSENVDHFQWSNGLDNSKSHVVKPMVTTRYSVTATYHDCSVDASVLITVNPLPSPQIISSDADSTVCYGQKITLSSKLPYNKYAWSTTAETATIELSEQGTKTIIVTVTDANSCKNSDTIQITINALPIITAQSKTICFGKSTSLSGQGAVNYVWSDGVSDGVDFSPSATKTYTVTGTDANQCSNTAIASVTVNALPTVTAQSKTICADKSTSLSGQGAVSYVWSDGVTDGVAFFPAATKIYSVTGTDANQCTNTATATVTVNTLPTITAQSKTICAGKLTSLSGQGAVSYVWSDGISDGVAFSPATTKIYTVTGTDGNNCTNTATATVTVNALPNVTAQNKTICAGKSTSLSGQGAVSYAWSDGISDGVDFSPSVTKTYTVTGTDANQCTNTATATVTVNTLPTLTAQSKTICAGKSTSLSGQGAVSYVWSDGITDGLAFSPSATKTYTVTGTDANQCTNTATATITVNALPIVSAQNKTICAGKSTSLSGQGAVSYAWSDGVTDGVAFSPTATKTYTVTGTDANNCTNTATATVTVNALPNVTAQSKTICAGESTSLSGQGAVSYAWSDGIKNSIVFSPAATKIYTVTGTDGNNCTNTATATVSVNPLPTLVTSKKDICYNETSQTITLQGVTANWYADVDTTILLQRDSLSYTPRLDVSQQSLTIYASIRDANKCTSQPTALTINRIPEYTGLHISGDSKRCESEKSPILLYANSHLGNKHWNAQPLKFEYINADSSAIIVGGFRPGLDSVFLSTTDVNGCVYATKHIIYTSPLPKANFVWEADNGLMKVRYRNTSDSALLPDLNTLLPNSYQWTFYKYEDQPYSTSRKTDTLISYPYGYHATKLVVTNSFGCVDSIQQTVFMDVHTAIYAPTAFVPGHESNDLAEFRPKAMNLESYDISIYDQWGTVLWHSDKLIGGQPAEAWNGTYNGQVLQSDTYIWRIKAKFTNSQTLTDADGSDVIWGNVVLLK